MSRGVFRKQRRFVPLYRRERYQIAENPNTEVNATTAALTLTEYSASIEFDVNVNATVLALTLDTYQSSISTGTNINATTASLTLSTNVAVINSTNVIITDVNTTEQWPDGSTGLVATGTGFC